MNRILQFLAETKVFFFATMDGPQPRVRPFGFVMEYNNRLYFGMGDHKPVCEQLKENPRFELCAYDSNKDVWMRLSGVAEFDHSYEAIQFAFQHSHSLRDLYGNPSGPQFAPFYVKNGVAVFQNKDGDMWSVYI